MNLNLIKEINWIKIGTQILLINVFCGIFFGFSKAQEIDNTRMQQDLEVAQKIIEELFSSNKDKGYYRFKHGRANALYLKDYGVILQVPSIEESNYYYNLSSNGKWISVAGQNFTIMGKDDDCNCPEKTKEQRDEQLKKQTKKIDSVFNARHKKITEKMKSFYLNYGDLIGQLKDSDKIMLIYDNDSDEDRLAHKIKIGKFKFKFDRDNEEDTEDPEEPEDKEEIYRQANKIVMEVRKSDLNNYKSGKLSKEQFVQQIKIQEENKNAENELELDILAGIFDKFVENEPDFFNLRERVRYQKLANFGVMYEMQLNPNYDNHNRAFSLERLDRLRDRQMIVRDKLIRINPDVRVTIAGTNEKNKEKEKEKDKSKKAKNKEKEYEDLKTELEKESEEVYQANKIDLEKFEKGIKEAIIQYGRTLKSLKSDEFLALNVQFEDWSPDSEKRLPKNMLFTVKKTILESYDKREITLEEAITKIEVKK